MPSTTGRERDPMTTTQAHSPATPTGGDPLFQPLTIRGLTLKNRIMSSAHACGTDDGGLTRLRFQRYHEEKARGGMALTMFGGSSNVAPDSPSVFQQLNVGTDAAIPHLREFSDRIHRHGCAIMCQITHLGRRGEDTADWWLPTIAPTRSRETLHRSFAREMDRHDIARVVRAFGAAAKRCEDGGLDGIETLAGGHLIGQFLGPDTNRRTDDFGGSLENRARFALMVYEEMRRSVSDRFLLGIRLSVDDDNPEGLSAADALGLARLLEREGAVDFFNAIFGRMDTELGLAEQNMPGMSMPLAPWLKPVAQFREQVSLPVFHAARITDVTTARHAIREGLLDMVAMTRAHIADPQIVNKIAAGHEDRIRPCVGATHCMHHKPFCIHNPATGRERELAQVIERSASPGRKVVVVGGGPAGLEAARVSAERGHDVVLFEAAPRLGGQVLIAAASWWRGDLMGIIDWRAAELERLGVEVRTSSYAEAADVLDCAPEVVIVATGGAPDTGWLPGAGHCASGWDLMTGTGQAGREVLVWDGTGRQAAATYADQLSRAGVEVTLVSRDDRVAAEVPYAERAIFRKHLAVQTVATVFEERLVRVSRDGNRLTATFANEMTGAEVARSADQVVVEHGTQPVDEVYHDLKARSSNDGVTDIAALISGRAQPRPKGAGFDLHRIGDAVSSRSIHAAMLDAYRLCCRF
jgi:2,4-dienoyl-CoA reductase-like NADH-dependent reductase (Old Yellow Enzyme family)/thioredoxin reductase